MHHFLENDKTGNFGRKALNQLNATWISRTRALELKNTTLLTFSAINLPSGSNARSGKSNRTFSIYTYTKSPWNSWTKSTPQGKHIIVFSYKSLSSAALYKFLVNTSLTPNALNKRSNCFKYTGRKLNLALTSCTWKITGESVNYGQERAKIPLS